MNDARLGAGRPSSGLPLLGRTLGVVAVVAVTAVGAVHYLAAADLGRAPGREAMRRDPRALPDPETTGSIARAADATRLDPCRIAARFPAAP